MLFYPKQGVNVRTVAHVTLPLQPGTDGPFPLPVPLKRITVMDVSFAAPTTHNGMIVRSIENIYGVDVRTDFGADVLQWYKQLTLPWPSEQSQLQYWTTQWPY